MICGYAEILKHSLIKNKNLFFWLKKNTSKIIQKKSKELIYSIKKSCKIKISFVNKDVNEKGARMILNLHTFAHAIELKIIILGRFHTERRYFQNDISF